MIGESLGPYKILEPLGAGGMGEVYLGEDTRLDRKVAIKVLPAEFASDPERLARFEQEARAAAALNHPHIAVVHDIGTEDDTHFMVQEYLEGQSLRERLDKGELPLDKALDLAIEVGEALIAAHKAGILHRDLKPDNIFVTEEGHAKVLDLGLAKLTEMAPPSTSSASMSPTMLGTVAGQVMGTAGYMAPEQVNAEEVDRRADLFAFGTVLYEMVTGRRAFAGESVVQTLSKIAHEEPAPLSEVVASAPAELQRIVRKCVAKQPGQRYQDADDLAVDLRQLRADIAAGLATASAGGETGAVPAAVGASPRAVWKLAAPLAVAALLAGILATWLATRPLPGRPMHLELPIEQTLAAGIGSSIAVSPDGEHVAYVIGTFRGPGGRDLMIRAFDQQSSRVLVSRESSPLQAPYNPFFSPDGEWVGFVIPGELRKVPVAGGTALPLATLDRARGADWGADDTIVFAPSPASGLFLVSANGGSPRPLTELTNGETTHRWPQFLPGDTRVLFTSLEIDAASTKTDADFDAATIQVVDLETGQRTVVLQGGSDGRYVSTGHLVYVSAGALLAIPFDPDMLRTTGVAVPLLEDVGTSPEGGAQLGFSEAGALVYARGDVASDPTFRLAWVDHQGNTEPLAFEPRGYETPRLSPQQDRIAVEIREENTTNIWILDIGTGTSQPLTSGGRSSFPVWSHDGEWLYFASWAGEARAMWLDPWESDIMRRRSDLSAEAELLYEADGEQIPTSASADGGVLMFHAVVGDGLPDIGMLTLDGDLDPRMVVSTADATAMPAIAPDGRRFAFQSSETGSGQVYVQDIETQSRRVISTGDADNINPVWSRDGTKIFYRSAAGQVSVVEVTQAPGLSFSPPRILFELAGLQNRFDVTADGARILGLIPTQPGGETGGVGPVLRLNVILNWFEELKERVPTGR